VTARMSAVLLAVLALVIAAPATTASLGARPTALERQWAIAAGRAVKIEIRKDGWYRVSRSRLVRAGADLGAPGRLRLYVEGKEVPIHVDRGAVEFYGLGLDTPSTDARTYWLVRGAPGGARIHIASALTGRKSGFARSFPFTVERKYRSIYSTLQNGDRQNYFGDMIYAKPTRLDVTAPDVARSAGALEVVVQGLSLRPHRIKVALNGAALGTIEFNAKANISRRFRLGRGLLREGVNALALTAVGGEADVSFVDTVRLTYARRYRAQHNRLGFSLPAGRPGRVSGFSRPDVTVIDVTRPGLPRLLRPTVVREGGTFAVQLSAGARTRRLLALTTPGAPAALERNRPSHWHASGGADLVIIGYRSFLPRLARLAKYRESQGLKVSLVDVEDLYDEFTFGDHGPEAIKTFLAGARKQWRPAPRYVILAGDATSDPRNYLRTGKRDFVPTKTVDTEYMETASDDWFADFDDDGVPEMAVGRLPIRTAAEATTMVDKIIGHEQVQPTGSPEALLVSDNGFESATDSLAKLLPSSTTAVTVNRRDGPTDAAVHGRILDGLNRGPSVVNYYGHGAVDIWTSAPLLKSADARSLRNAGRLSLFVMMTCLNGYFIEPKTESLAEALLRTPTGGAFAVWASSGLTVPSDQIRANEELFRQIAATSSPRLGDAMVRAKSIIHDQDVRRTWIFFGDPLTHLY
jgi:peptidase C25-like protein